MNDKENYSEFPTYEDSLKAIKNLKAKKWPKRENFNSPQKYSKEVEKLILSEFKILPNLLFFQKPEKFPFKIFRAREVNSFTNIDLFTEHSYPPINLVKYGRCNFPNYPVFYGSNNAVTSLIEAAGSTNYKNRFFCISTWSIRKSEKEFSIQNFLHSELHETNYFGQLAKIEIEKFNQTIENGLSKNQEKGLKIFLEFLHNSFINDESYTISSSLAHAAIYAPHNYATDILIYPSKQTELRGVNFAIKPNFVDNEMKVERFYIVELENYNPINGKVKVTISKYGELENNVIFWKELSNENLEYEKNFMSDFKSMLPNNYRVTYEKKAK
jgi:uncharacterized protein YkuJ